MDMMRRTQWVLSVALAGGLLVPAGRWAGAAEQDASLLQPVQEAIEGALSLMPSETERIARLAGHFQVPTSTIERLRRTPHEWDEIVTQLAAAAELTRAHPRQHASIINALSRIEVLRREQRSWSQIAGELDLKMSGIAGQLQQVSERLRASAAPPMPRGVRGPEPLERTLQPPSPAEQPFYEAR